MSELQPELGIHLHDLLVGTIRLRDGSFSEFRLQPSYKERHPRPVLGQVFEDDLDRVHTGLVRLPPFFSNLLPEGPLRQLIADDIGVHQIREFYLLSHIGDDLPGAVRALPLTELDRELAQEVAAQVQPSTHGLRFSLAGMQLKFSMREDERGLTLPMKDELGDWIVKLPDARFARVPEHELSMLRWAHACGIEVPDAKLVPVASLRGLPDKVIEAGGTAFAIRRFDRKREHNGHLSRIHQEDFAQVFGLYPDGKYDKHNYESIAKVIYYTVGADGFWEFVKRLIFVVLSGNADAHHKNWSLRYPDGIHAELAPAYDQVATVLYQGVDDSLALNLAKSKAFEQVSVDSFVRMANKIGAHERDMTGWVRDCVAAILDAWHTVASEIPLEPDEKAKIERHWRRIPLANLNDS